MSGIPLLGQLPARGDRRRTALAAVGPGLLGHTLVNWALEHVESGLVSVSLVREPVGEPVGSTLLAALVLGELPGRLTLVGAPIVVAGILVTTREYGW